MLQEGNARSNAPSARLYASRAEADSAAINADGNGRCRSGLELAA
jgi:hypothetical protein